MVKQLAINICIIYMLKTRPLWFHHIYLSLNPSF